MDINKKMKSDLGNAKELDNAEKDKVTQVKTSDLRKNDKPVTSESRKKSQAAHQGGGRKS